MFLTTIIFTTCSVLLVNSAISVDGLSCYECDSQVDIDCSDDSYVNSKYLVPCAQNHIPAGNMACLKEITVFEYSRSHNLGGSSSSSSSLSSNRQSQPRVLRRCFYGIIPSYSNNYRSYGRYDEDYYMDDECVRSLIIENGHKAERKLCHCYQDACNTAPSVKISTILGLILCFGLLLR